MSECPICNSQAQQKLLDWKKFEIMSCTSCYLIYTIPLPSDEELETYYQGFMYQKPGNYEIQKKVEARKKELKKLFALSDDKSQQANISFLDFGAGTGAVYKAARELGLECYYHDLDQQAIGFTKTNFGLKDEYIIDDIKKCDRKFDLNFSYNVIEHVKEPKSFLEDLLDQLEDEGTLVIKTPRGGNTETLFNPMIAVRGYFLEALKYNSFGKSTKAFFKRFWHCDPPRHIYAFSEKSFESMMEQSAHKNVDYAVSYYTTAWFENTITKQFFSRDEQLSFIKSILFRLSLIPIIPIEVLLQSLKWLFLKLGILSSAGLILTVKKSSK